MNKIDDSGIDLEGGEQHNIHRKAENVEVIVKKGRTCCQILTMQYNIHRKAENVEEVIVKKGRTCCQILTIFLFVLSIFVLAVIVVGVGLALVIAALALVIAVVLCVLLLPIPLLPCVLSFLRYQHLTNQINTEQKEGILRSMFQWLLHVDALFTNQPKLFDYNHQGYLYDVFVLYPVKLFFFLRKYLFPKVNSSFIRLCSARVSCIFMVLISYLILFYVFLFITEIFTILGEKYEYSVGEQWFTIIELSILLNVMSVLLPFVLMFSWSSHIAILFNRLEAENLLDASFEVQSKVFFGVTLSLIHEFIELNGGKETFKGMTTADVSQRFVIPQTSHDGVSYCEMMRKKGHHGVKQANVFVSHAWRYEFLDVVDALEYHFSKEDKASVVLWFDLFCNNQNNTEDIPFEWWCGTFQSSIKSIGRTVAIFLPWQQPIPLTRVWCLWEMFISHRTKVKFEIAMTVSEEENFVRSLAHDPDAFNRMLSSIDVKKSTALKSSDKEKIFRVIEQTVGFHEMNRELLRLIRNQLYNRLNVMLKERAVTPEKRLLVLRSLYFLTRDVGDYKTSLSRAMEYAQLCHTVKKPTDLETLEAHFFYGNMCYLLGYWEAAVKCLQPLMDYMLLELQMSRDSLLVMRTQRLLGCCLYHTDKRAEGRWILEDCFERVSRYDGFDLEASLIYIDWMKVIQQELTHEAQAKQTEKLTKKKKLTKKTNHNDNLKVTVDENAKSKVTDMDLHKVYRGGVVKLASNDVDGTHPYSLAFKMQAAFHKRDSQEVESILAKMEEKLGPEHPEVIEWILRINNPFENAHCMRRAISCYNICKSLYKRSENHPHLLKALFMVRRYWHSVYLNLAILLISTASLAASYYFAYHSLENQNDDTQSETNNIMVGFFLMLTWLFLLVQNSKEESKEELHREEIPIATLKARSADANLLTHQASTWPIFIQMGHKVFSTLLSASQLVPAMATFHLWLKKSIFFGYFLAGVVSGFCAMVIVVAVLSGITQESHLVIHQLELIEDSRKLLRATLVDLPWLPSKPQTTGSIDRESTVTSAASDITHLITLLRENGKSECNEAGE